jgi:hypothetical protein
MISHPLLVIFPQRTVLSACVHDHTIELLAEENEDVLFLLG